MRNILFFIFSIILVACTQKSTKTLLIGKWISDDPDSSILTFDQNGNYFIDKIENGKLNREFTLRYKVSDDGKHFTAILKPGDEPQFELNKITESELQIVLGNFIRKYKRYKMP
jgi:hypothetical protein